MLLMPAYGWIQTELGRFVLEPTDRPPMDRAACAGVC